MLNEKIQPGNFYQTKSGVVVKVIYVIGLDPDYDDSAYHKTHALPAPVIGRLPSGQIMQWQIDGCVPKDSNWSTDWNLTSIDNPEPKGVA